MCTKNTSCGPRRHLNDAGFVLLMPQGNIMHVISSFGLNMGQIALLPVLNARFQLKMGLRAPFGPVWRQYRHQNAPKVSAHLKIIIRWCRLVNRVVLR